MKMSDNIWKMLAGIKWLKKFNVVGKGINVADYKFIQCKIRKLYRAVEGETSIARKEKEILKIKF